MIKAIFLHMGYVESGRVGMVMASTTEKFTDPSKAVSSLAEELFKLWKNEHLDTHHATCCGRVYWDNSKFCCQCGKSLVNKTGVSLSGMSEFEEWLADLSNRTANDIATNDEENWTLWSTITELFPLKKSEIVEVHWAEPLLCAIVHEEYRNKFVNRYNKQIKEIHNKGPWNFDQILRKELESRTI